MGVRLPPRAPFKMKQMTKPSIIFDSDKRLKGQPKALRPHYTIEDVERHVSKEYRVVYYRQIADWLLYDIKEISKELNESMKKK